MSPRYMVARYLGQCRTCKGPISPGEAIVWAGKGDTRHQNCGSPARTVSTYTRFSSGAEVYQNRSGRCEDAPCCGCCS